MEEPIPYLHTELLKQGQVYKMLFDTAAEGLILCNESGHILLCNERAVDLFGYSREELIGNTVDVLVPAAMRHNHQHHRESYRKHPSRRTMGSGMDLSGQRKDGITFPVEVSLNFTQIGGVMMIMAFITDISKRKKAEQDLARLNMELEQRVVERTRELKESQRLYSLIARNFPYGTINVFDRQLNYIFVEGRELFKMGVTSEQLVGTNYLDRLPADLTPFIREQLGRVFEGEDISFEVTVGKSTYELHGVGLEGVKGQVHHILVVEHDITRQKQAEEDIRVALSKERELNELKSRFVSMASHEFRTPLSTILTSLSLAQKYEKPEDDDKRQKHYGRIRTSVHNLTGILKNFLSLDKLETGHVAAKAEPVNLDALIGDICEEMQAIAKPGQKMDCKLDGPADCMNDASILRNILVNLASNAIKYSDEGKTIRLRTVVDDQKIQMSVSDEGIGIPQAEQFHLFQRFFRANNATNIQGTGLGLTIVRKYLDLLGGDIWFESTEHVGTTFTFVIPRNLTI